MNAIEQSSPPAAIRRRGSASYSYSADLVVLHDPLGASAESIRALRAHVVAQHLHLGRRGLAVCGASEGVGSTFIASNLAVALAQSGVKTLLVDGDLRQSTLASKFVPPVPQQGLTECLVAGATQLDEYIAPEVLPNLALMYAGAAIPNPQEDLAREHFEHIAQLCMREFEITIFDCPPANLYADARRLAGVAGYGLVVARRHRSLVSDVRTLVTQIISDHAQVIGTVMND